MALKPDENYKKMLNKALASEIAASIQYMLQHSKIDKLKRRVLPENILSGDLTVYDKIAEMLKKFAIDEMKHMAAIAERMFVLGIEDISLKPTSIEIGDSLSD